MSHDRSPREAVEHVSENVLEPRGVPQITPSDAVDSGRPKVSVDPQQAGPTINRLTGGVDIDDRQLDDPVMRARMDASRLAIDYGVWDWARHCERLIPHRFL
jgi:hypothetical protein